MPLAIDKIVRRARPRSATPEQPLARGGPRHCSLDADVVGGRALGRGASGVSTGNERLRRRAFGAERFVESRVEGITESFHVAAPIATNKSRR